MCLSASEPAASSELERVVSNHAIIVGGAHVAPASEKSRMRLRASALKTVSELAWRQPIASHTRRAEKLDEDEVSECESQQNWRDFCKNRAQDADYQE